jgi:predicted HAD superfamily Cof-like phosphohydrolase
VYNIISGPVKCYDKFGIGPKSVAYSPEEHLFRVACLNEEIQEFREAVDKEDYNEQVDAVADLIIFAVGTLYRMDIINDSLDIILEQDKYLDEYINELDSKTYIDRIENLINNFKSNPDQEYIEGIILASLLYVYKYYDINDFMIYYNRVINANMSKIVGKNSKRGSFAIDLKKPEGWKTPSFEGLSV